MTWPTAFIPSTKGCLRVNEGQRVTGSSCFSKSRSVLLGPTTECAAPAGCGLLSRRAGAEGAARLQWRERRDPEEAQLGQPTALPVPGGPSGTWTPSCLINHLVWCVNRPPCRTASNGTFRHKKKCDRWGPCRWRNNPVLPKHGKFSFVPNEILYGQVLIYKASTVFFMTCIFHCWWTMLLFCPFGVH